MKRSSDGRFRSLPIGKKTKKMLEVENRLKKRIEELWDEYYIKKEWGQKKMENLFRTPRQMIFGPLPGKRITWIKRLNLPVRESNYVEAKLVVAPKNECEVCGDDTVTLDKAHWVDKAIGGSNRMFNRILLCPTCHRKLHNEDDRIIYLTKVSLLYRVMGVFIERSKHTLNEKENLLKLSEAIINRQPFEI